MEELERNSPAVTPEVPKFANQAVGEQGAGDFWIEEGLVRRAYPLGAARFEGILPRSSVHKGVVEKHLVPVALLTCEVMK